jgi:hypothetical protein
LNFTVAPGFAVWNALPRSVNAPVSEAAAKTLIVPVARGAVVLGAPGVVVVVVDWVGKTGVGRKMPLDVVVVVAALTVVVATFTVDAAVVGVTALATVVVEGSAGRAVDAVVVLVSVDSEVACVVPGEATGLLLLPQAAASSAVVTVATARRRVNRCMTGTLLRA